MSCDKNAPKSSFVKSVSRLLPDGWVGLKSSGYRCHFRAFQLKLFILDTRNFGNGSVVQKLQLFEVARISEFFGRPEKKSRNVNIRLLTCCEPVSCPSLLINVSPDPGLRQIVRRGHGGQYQDGSERFCFFISLTKKSVKTGSPNRLSLSLNLTFRGFCENRVFKVSIGRSVCPGFIYQWQKSIIIRTDRHTDRRKH